jgi:hypothetical protein
MELTAKEILTEKEFCKLHSGFHGEQIDSLKQIWLQSFNGEELYEFVTHCIEIKGKEIAQEVLEQGVKLGFDFRESQSMVGPYTTDSTGIMDFQNSKDKIINSLFPESK